MIRIDPTFYFIFILIVSLSIACDYQFDNPLDPKVSPDEWASTNLTATAIDDQTIRLNWTDNCLFELGFRIERKIGNGDFAQLCEVDADVTNCEDSGLNSDELYIYRVKAYTQNNESGYSNEMVDPWHVIDFDGNVYNTVKIGTQVWMDENLKVTHYRNGNDIPNVTDGTGWSNLTTGAYCNYDNNPNNANTYGRLYNWYAVIDNRNIAPTGWHVPSDADWQILIDYLGGYAFSGGKLKEAGTTHWISPNTGATNESGFSALPAGYRYYNGSYFSLGGDAIFWSSTAGDLDTAWYRTLSYLSTNVSRGNNDEQNGFSLRLVRD